MTESQEAAASMFVDGANRTHETLSFGQLLRLIICLKGWDV